MIQREALSLVNHLVVSPYKEVEVGCKNDLFISLSKYCVYNLNWTCSLDVDVNIRGARAERAVGDGGRPLVQEGGRRGAEDPQDDELGLH